MKTKKQLRRMMSMFSHPRAERAIDAIVLGIAAAWFLYVVRLPPLYNGITSCCDSGLYINIARILSFPSDFIYQYGFRTLGYPWFLHLHFSLLEMLRLDPWLDGVTASLFTAFALHIAGAVFLYRSVLRAGLQLHRAVLWILFLHPGLVSHAAIPLTDGFATSMLMFAFGCMLRLDRKLTWKTACFAASMGALLGWIVLTRPSHLGASMVCLAVFCAMSILYSIRLRVPSLLFLPIAALFFFGVVLSGRIAGCYDLDHRPCIYIREDRDMMLRPLLETQSHGARTYVVNYDHANGTYHGYMQTVDDPFFIAHFGCLTDMKNVTEDLRNCYTANMVYLPLFFAKKTVALFDNFHINTYAVYITRWPHIAVNRLFGLMGFIGFFAMLAGVVIFVRKGNAMDLRLLPFVFVIAYWLSSLITTAESRYGFPLVPFSLFGFVYAVQHLSKRKTPHRCMLIIFCVLLGFAFLLQAHLWDTADPFIPGNTP